MHESDRGFKRGGGRGDRLLATFAQAIRIGSGRRPPSSE
jgi:hypothetical protein